MSVFDGLREHWDSTSDVVLDALAMLLCAVCVGAFLSIAWLVW